MIYTDLKMFGLLACDGCGAVVKDSHQPLHDRWHANPLHPDHVPRGPTEAEWGKALDESWAWFSEKLGRTPCAYDVQMWIDGYAPRS